MYCTLLTRHIQSCTTCPHTDFLLLPINSGKFLLSRYLRLPKPVHSSSKPRFSRGSSPILISEAGSAIPPDISLPAQLIDVVLDCFSRLHPHFPVASESNRRLPSALEASTRATHDTVPTYMTSSLQRWGRLSENSFGVLFRRLPPLLGSALSERQRKKPRLSPIPGLPCMHCPPTQLVGGYRKIRVFLNYYIFLGS